MIILLIVSVLGKPEKDFNMYIIKLIIFTSIFFSVPFFNNILKPGMEKIDFRNFFHILVNGIELKN